MTICCGLSTTIVYLSVLLIYLKFQSFCKVKHMGTCQSYFDIGLPQILISLDCSICFFFHLCWFYYLLLDINKKNI